MNNDLDGNKALGNNLTKIKGVGPMLSHAICYLTKIDKTAKTGFLSEEDIKKLNDTMKNISSQNLPKWLLNRRADPETGEDLHLFMSNLDFIKTNDLKQMMKIKSYRGFRHSAKLPSRGQRTKSNFRKSKSTNKSGSLGVKRKKK